MDQSQRIYAVRVKATQINSSNITKPAGPTTVSCMMQHLAFPGFSPNIWLLGRASVPQPSLLNDGHKVKRSTVGAKHLKVLITIWNGEREKKTDGDSKKRKKRSESDNIWNNYCWEEEWQRGLEKSWENPCKTSTCFTASSELRDSTMRKYEMGIFRFWLEDRGTQCQYTHRTKIETDDWKTFWNMKALGQHRRKKDEGLFIMNEFFGRFYAVSSPKVSNSREEVALVLVVRLICPVRRPKAQVRRLMLALSSTVHHRKFTLYGFMTSSGMTRLTPVYGFWAKELVHLVGKCFWVVV